MKLHVLLVSVLLVSSQILVAQLRPTLDSSNRDALVSSQTTWINGKVMVEGGSAPPQGTVVILMCGSQERARTSAASDGSFSIALTSYPSASMSDSEQTQSTGSSSVLPGNCEIYANAPEYASDSLNLLEAGQTSMTQVGTIFLHSRVATPGQTVSVSDLAIPEKAKKEFEKGKDQEKKRKWTAAYQYFQRAVQQYPRYALAWLEMGRSQVNQNDFSGAQQSFHQAAEQDSHLIDAYVEIARIAARQEHWKDLADSTSHILELSPDASIPAWFLNSAANFNLGDIAQAETSATRGLRLDTSHQFPQLEYLYAMILARRGNYAQAVDHVKTFLYLSPNDPQAQIAKGQLQQFETLVNSRSGAVSAPVNPASPAK